MSAKTSFRRAPQRGFILVTGMLFLVIMTLVGLAMFRSTGLMDRITANARDKQRAFEAAQSALQYGEWWLSSQTLGAASACNSLADGDTLANVHVCSTALPTSAYASPLTVGFTHKPPNMYVSTAAGLATSGDTNYYQLPAFYIEYLGLSTAAGSVGAPTYQITAFGYGGDALTMSIVRSTYQLAATSGSGGGTGVGGL
jgi:type IV pilus assembly protein PilX